MFSWAVQPSVKMLHLLDERRKWHGCLAVSIVKMGRACSDRGIGYHGRGDLELTIRNLDDLEKAKPLIQKSFEEN